VVPVYGTRWFVSECRHVVTCSVQVAGLPAHRPWNILVGVSLPNQLRPVRRTGRGAVHDLVSAGVQVADACSAAVAAEAGAAGTSLRRARLPHHRGGEESPRTQFSRSGRHARLLSRADFAHRFATSTSAGQYISQNCLSREEPHYSGRSSVPSRREVRARRGATCAAEGVMLRQKAWWATAGIPWSTSLGTRPRYGRPAIPTSSEPHRCEAPTTRLDHAGSDDHSTRSRW